MEKKIELSAPPAEIIINLETEKEKIMETKKIEVSRDQVVSLAKEMNSILMDCKIQVGKQYAKDVIIGQILSHADEMIYTDFILADENDNRVIFSPEAQETLVALGQVIPQPPAAKPARATRGTAAKKEKVEKKYSWSDASEQAIRTLPAGFTVETVKAEAIKLYKANRSDKQESDGVPKNTFRYMVDSLFRFGILEKVETGGYKLVSTSTPATV